MEEIMLGINEEHMKNNVIIGHSQCKLMRERSCLTNLISYYNKATHLDEDRKSADVILLDFSTAVDAVSHSILLEQMSGI